jgi:hypothetical protein
MALFLAHSELRNITASQEIFLNSSKIIDELKAQCKKLEDGNRITNTVSNKSKEVVE